MRRRTWIAAGGVMAGALWAAPETVPDTARAQWLNHLLPLPHEIALTRSVTLPPAEVGIAVTPAAGPVQAQIRDELIALFTEKAALRPAGSRFQIVLGVLDSQRQVDGRAVPEAERLQSCPNSQQAYLIRPDGEGRLVVAALHERGLYYGAQTLRQLLAARFTREAITIPLATVTDWPDMEERGSWNSARVVPYLASLKLNFYTHICAGVKQPDGLPRPLLDPTVVALLRRHAMTERVQMPHHLNYFDRLYGLYGLYPELKGQGDRAVCAGEQYKFAKRDIPVICASQPRWRTILAGMLEALAEQGATDVSVWLSEFTGQCECAACLASTQTQAESKLVTEAWQAARQRFPTLGLRVFYSQGDASPATAQALAVLPPEVKIERVYSLHKPFLDAAQQGKWVLSFSGYDCIANPDNRFQDPAAIMGPIVKGHTAKLRGVLTCSYPYYGDGSLPPAYYPVVYSFPLSALAEWSWNVQGRTPRQFAEAWATGAGYDQPARFADWVEAMSALKTALAQPRAPGVGLPNAKGFRNPFATVGDSIRARKPIGLYGAGELTTATLRCQEALALAGPLNRPEALTETRYFQALLATYQELDRLSTALTDLDLADPANRLKLRDAWAAYQGAVGAALTTNAKRIELWRAEPADYVEKAHAEILGQWQRVQKTMDEAIAALLAGGPEPAKP